VLILGFKVKSERTFDVEQCSHPFPSADDSSCPPTVLRPRHTVTSDHNPYYYGLPMDGTMDTCSTCTSLGFRLGASLTIRSVDDDAAGGSWDPKVPTAPPSPSQGQGRPPRPYRLQIRVARRMERTVGFSRAWQPRFRRENNYYVPK